MDGCVLLTSTPSCVVSPRGDPSGCALGIARRGETTHEGVDVNNTHPSMINPLNNQVIILHMLCVVWSHHYFSSNSIVTNFGLWSHESFVKDGSQGPLLLIQTNFDPCMDKQLLIITAITKY